MLFKTSIQENAEFKDMYGINGWQWYKMEPSYKIRFILYINFVMQCETDPDTEKGILTEFLSGKRTDNGIPRSFMRSATSRHIFALLSKLEPWKMEHNK